MDVQNVVNGRWMAASGGHRGPVFGLMHVDMVDEAIKLIDARAYGNHGVHFHVEWCCHAAAPLSRAVARRMEPHFLIFYGS